MIPSQSAHHPAVSSYVPFLAGGWSARRILINNVGERGLWAQRCGSGFGVRNAPISILSLRGAVHGWLTMGQGVSFVFLS